MHDDGEAKKLRYNEIVCLIQLRPEHHHFCSISTFVGVNYSAFRNEKYQWIFSVIIDHQKHFWTVAALG